MTMVGVLSLRLFFSARGVHNPPMTRGVSEVALTMIEEGLSYTDLYRPSISQHLLAIASAL